MDEENDVVMKDDQSQHVLQSAPITSEADTAMLEPEQSVESPPPSL